MVNTSVRAANADSETTPAIAIRWSVVMSEGRFWRRLHLSNLAQMGDVGLHTATLTGDNTIIRINDATHDVAA